MNQAEQSMYADFIMAMRQRGVQEQSAESPPENAAAEKLYGEKYAVIRADFQNRVEERLESGP